MAGSRSPSLNLGERLARPGILIRPTSTQGCFGVKDKELLESKIEVKIGENKVKMVELSSDGLQAYVELVDEADIDKVLDSELKLSKRGQPLEMEYFDLTEVWRPYLVVSGLEDWIREDMVEDHFEELVNGAAIESVEIHENEAKIMFRNPQVALEFPSSTDLLGQTLDIEVRYSSPSEEEEMVLAVRGLPLGKIPEEKLRGALVSHFTKHTGYKASECRIVNGVGYMTFGDKAALKSILSCPPSATFSGKTPLEVSAAPVSHMMGDKPDAAHVRTYSSASESSVFSPSSSMDSRQFRKELGREVSKESVDSQFEMGSTDLESLRSYQQQRSRNSSSTSSDGGYSLPAPSSGMPRREIPSGILFTVPEQSTPDGGGFPSVSGSPGGRICSDMQIQDLDINGPGVSNSPTKICIEDIPHSKRDMSLIRYYLHSLVSQDCEVKAYGKTFLATFQQPIDFQALKEKGSSNSLDGFFLSFYKLDSSKTLLVTFEGPLPQKYTVQLHFESFTGKKSVDNVELSPPKKAYVTFKNSQGVQTAISDPECSLMDGQSIYLEEYYDFMAEGVENEEETQPIPPTVTPKFDWHPETTPIGINESVWVERNLSELKDILAPLNACGSVEDNNGTPTLKVSPLAGSEKMSDWSNQIKDAVHCFLSNFEEVTTDLPAEYGRAELLNCAESAASDNLLVLVDNDVLTLAGKRDIVEEVIGIIHMKMAELKEVVSEDKTYPRKQVKYLKKFCERKLNNIKPVVKFRLEAIEGLVTVEGNKEGRTAFWKAVDDEICRLKEKYIVLEPEKFKLLESKQGVDEIEAAIGLKMADIVYDLEETPTSYTLYILSPSQVPKGTLKTIKDLLKKLVKSQVYNIAEPTKFRFCSDVQWKKMVARIQRNEFIRITVDDHTHSVIVTGERSMVDGVISKLQVFLSDQTSVEEQLRIDTHHWKVMTSTAGLGQELTAIKSAIQNEDVKINWPQEKNIEFQSDVIIVIKGDPTQVDKVKGKLETLRKKVCHMEERRSNVPAAVQVVESMQDNIRVLETQYGASVAVSVTSDDLEPGWTRSQSADIVGTKLCSATCNNEVRISIYEGDFTKHNHVDVIIIFIPPDPNQQSDSNLRLLFAAGGADLRNDFNMRISQLFKQSAGDLFTCQPGKLQCSQLWCCFIPTWSGNTMNEEYYLQECLSKALSKTKALSTVLFAPITPAPLNYPAKVFAENLISSITCTSMISSDLTVAVYVSDASHGRVFMTQFEASKCCVSSSFMSTVKVISSSIGSFITLSKGSLLDQQADVYVNSTNSNLDLKTGTLSKVILAECGEELQKKCSEYAPMKAEQVAVTEAMKLKAKFLYHIALPDYQLDHHSATRKFRGTVKAILRTAKDNGVTSLAIPSLGVGNLHYPAQTSAKILFEEVIDFNSRNTGTGMKFHFVIYDQATHDEFSKEYALKMSSAVPQKRKLKESSKPCAGVTRLSVENSDISEEEVDVIINTTSENMQLSHSAVSKALLDKAGSILQQTCDQLIQSGLQLDCGQVVETKAFGRLKCKRIIHAHVPARKDALKSGIDHSSLIKEIIAECLRRAVALGMTSISFPAFGFGQGGYSINEVAEPMLTAFRDFGRQGPSQIKVIKVVIFDQKLHKQFFDFFTSFFKVDLSAPLRIVSTFTSKLSPKGGYSLRYAELQDSSAATSPQTRLEPVQSELLLFDIYAPSTESCGRIAAKLKDFVKDKCVVEEYEDPILANLIDSDIADMKSIGTSLQVQVNVIPQIKKIEILGEMARAKDAKIKILEVINNIRLSKSGLNLFQWQTESADDIEQYSEEDSFMLERARAKGVHALQLVIDSIEVVVDLDQMEERNKETGVVRKVMRVHSKPKFLPPNYWEPQPLDADGNPSTIHMFDVPQGSTEYQETLTHFHDTINQQVTISSLKRVQNPTLYQKHTTLQDTLGKKYPKKKIDVKHLFHGSSEESIKCIASQGFNRILASDANAAYYGMGVYFALNSSYSAQTKYAKADKDSQQSMFICRVIIGEYALGKKGMKIAPPLREGSTELYDTLVENTDQPTIFVTMTDAQAYPEYLVTFKPEKKGGKT